MQLLRHAENQGCCEPTAKMLSYVFMKNVALFNLPRTSKEAVLKLLKLINVKV